MPLRAQSKSHGDAIQNTGLAQLGRGVLLPALRQEPTDRQRVEGRPGGPPLPTFGRRPSEDDVIVGRSADAH